MKIESSVKVVCLGLFLAIVAGCASSGRKIEADKISQIQKGVSTRADVERLLGPPTHVGLAGDGKRILVYNHFSSDGSKHAATRAVGTVLGGIIPGGGLGGLYATQAAGAAVGASGQTKNRQQTVQIIIGADNVVQDLEFSDNTTTITTGVGTAKSTTEKTAPEGKK